MQDPNYAAEQAEAIKKELHLLIANSTQEKYILLKGANLVLIKQVFNIKKLIIRKTEKFKAKLIIKSFS